MGCWAFFFGFPTVGYRWLLYQSQFKRHQAGARAGFVHDQPAIGQANIDKTGASGFGSSGPYVDRPSYDSVAQALSGFLSVVVDYQRPQFLGPALADAITGIYASQGILAALVLGGIFGVFLSGYWLARFLPAGSRLLLGLTVMAGAKPKETVDPAEAARKLWTPERQVAAVTCGAQGCWYVSGDDPNRPSGKAPLPCP